jgi:hypothetical protein
LIYWRAGYWYYRLTLASGPVQDPANSKAAEMEMAEMTASSGNPYVFPIGLYLKPKTDI